MIVHVFIEKCSFLVDRLGRTSEFYIEVEQKGGGGGGGFWLRSRALRFI